MTKETTHRGWLVGAILVLILLAAFVLRTWHVDYADGQLPHPDERSTVAFYAPSIQWPPEGTNPLDPRRSALNPLWDTTRGERRSYTYGHFPLYLLVLTANTVHKLAPLAEQLGASPDLVNTLRTANGVPGFAIVGRVIMGIADTLTVFLVFLLADRIYGRRKGYRWVGLLAAAFSAFSVLQVQLSHFFAVDPISTTFTVLAVYGALRMVNGRSWAWSIITGVGAGLAIASKFSALPILAAPVVAGMLIWWRGRRKAKEGTRGEDGTSEADDGATVSIWRAFGLVAVALAVAVVVFAVTSPFAILDWESFSRAVLVEQGAMVRGQADFPFTRQYRGTLPYLYHIEQLVRWGLGWPLGLLAFISLGWVFVKLFIGKARDGEILILSWIVPYFGLTGLFLAKFMRYSVPITPFLMVLAAGLIAAMWARGQGKEGNLAKEGNEARDGSGGQKPEVVEADGQNSEVVAVDDQTPPEEVSESSVADEQSPPPTPHPPRPIWRWLAVGTATVALLGAVLWTLAYVNGVYNTTHPWIKASEWMYANIPDGSTIMSEQWDDSLPYDLPEPNSNRGRFRFIDWGPFEEDTAEKYQRMKDTLRAADYVALSSNRIYGAVDNLPQRYPMTNRYYQLLFDGQLGYERALEVVNSPNLLGITIDDTGADESFTLYDHPRVLVFRKVRDLSDAEWDALLGGSWETAQPWDVGEPTLIQRLWETLGLTDAAPPPPPPADDETGGKTLLLDQPLSEQPVVQDFRWNAVASQSTPLAVVVWWLALFLIGVIAWPITFSVFRGFRDRGYLLSRTLGWLLLGYIVWLLASLRVGQNSLPYILATLAGIALVSLLLWRRQRSQMAAFWRAERHVVLFGEGVFAAAYLLFVVFRIANPDIWQPWQGGEKFMEFAFLNAILRSAHMPPIDPYFAGGTINYYYFGHYLVGLLIKLTGIWSSVAFNLAVPTVFALTVGNVFCLGYNLASGLRGRRELQATGGKLYEVPERSGVEVEDGRPQIDPRLPLDPWLSDGTLPAAGNESAGEPGSPWTDASHLTAAEETAPDAGQETDKDEWGEPSTPDESAQSVGWSGRRAALATGLLAAFFVAMLGNVDGGGQLVRKLAEQSTTGFESMLPGVQTGVRALSGLVHVLGPAQLPSYNYWDPSRVIPFTINEFPYWSFLFADLHPHMIGIPFTVLFLALAFALLMRPMRVVGEGRRLRIATGGVLMVFLALTLGALAVINTWDLPTYFGLGVLVWLVREWRTGRLSENRGRALLRTGVFAVGLVAGALLLYWPFFAHYKALASSGVGLSDVKTELGKWLNVWGFLGFLAVSFLLVELRGRYADGAASTGSAAGGRNARDTDAAAEPVEAAGVVRDPALLRWLRLAMDRFGELSQVVELTPQLSARAGAAIGISVLAAAALWLTGWHVPAALLLPLLAAFALLWRRSGTNQRAFLAILIFTALLVLIGVEFVYLKDHLQGGEWRRMNTLFKFYIQVWVMLALATAVALPDVWRFIHSRWRRGWRVVWTVAFGWLLLLSLAFLVFGTASRLDDRFPRENGRPPVGTLDGMAYMQAGRYTWNPDPAQSANSWIDLRYDYDAIRWLLDNVSGTPLVAEAPIGYYREGGLRVASFTGFPTFIGFHQEGEQRYGSQTGPRRSQAEEFWRTPDAARARQLIDELGVDYIYVGQLERITTPADGLAKFAVLEEQGVIEVVYQNEQVVIYKVSR